MPGNIRNITHTHDSSLAGSVMVKFQANTRNQPFTVEDKRDAARCNAVPGSKVSVWKVNVVETPGVVAEARLKEPTQLTKDEAYHTFDQLAIDEAYVDAQRNKAGGQLALAASKRLERGEQNMDNTESSWKFIKDSWIDQGRSLAIFSILREKLDDGKLSWDEPVA